MDVIDVHKKCLSYDEWTSLTSTLKKFFFLNCVQLIIDVVRKKIELRT